MDIFNFCWMTLLDESKKCCVFFDKNTCNARNDIDENFSKPINRISYLYKFGSYNISFFHLCFKEFFTKAADSIKIIDNICSIKNLTICSMSTGPGTDIIGLLYSLYVFNKPLTNPTAFKVISRHGSWRNLVTAMISSSIISVPDGSTCKLIECDFLKSLSKKAEGYLGAADVLLMFNTFSSSVMAEKVICDTLKKVIQLLKPGALLFFISSKEKSAYFRELDSFGSFLYGPVEVTLENMPYNEKIVETVGVKPVCSGRSLFAVWQKLHETSCDINFRKAIDSTGQNIDSSKTNFNNSTKNTPATSLNVSDSVMKKRYVLQCGSNHKNEPNNGNNMHSLMKNFETLITKLEGLIPSEDSLKTPNVKEKQSSNSQHHHQNMHEAHCRCSVKLSQCIENDLTCYHSLRCHKGTNVDNCIHSMSVVNNSSRTLPQESPYIVIPLQNLSKESLIQILSISQNKSSANKTATNLLPKKEKS